MEVSMRKYSKRKLFRLTVVLAALIFVIANRHILTLVTATAVFKHPHTVKVISDVTTETTHYHPDRSCCYDLHSQ